MAWGRDENDWNLDPTIGGPDGVRLTPAQYFQLKYIATKEIKQNGRNMHEAMVARINSESYQRASGGPDNRKETLLKLIYHDYYNAAMWKLRNEDKDLDQAIKAKLEQRRDEQRNETDPRKLPSSVPPGLPASLGR